MNGGVLKLEMTDQPELGRGLAGADKPFSLSSGTGPGMNK
jgi:putative alpha-1,2-mannosidase